ncbi:MAG TPA: response regulator, partial [Nannocystaceae bacterium]|nr:response regulator [Nannocystaceae bacterium]
NRAQPPDMAQDPYRYFRIEARELLEQLGSGVLELEKGAPSAELVSRLLRLAHTVKGAARVVKRIEIAELAHAVEDALAPLRAGDVAATRAQVDALLRHLDEMSAHVALLAPTAEPQASAPRPAAEEPLRAVRVDVEEMDALLEALAQANVQLGSLRRSTLEAEHATQLAELLVEQLARRATGRAPASAGSTPLAEELGTSLARLHRGLRGTVDRLARELGQLRETAEHLRLVPASAVFAALERGVRDAARSAGRLARFDGRGGDVRLDAHVLAGVQGALVQLVRNAVAHGIESAADRSAHGKPSEGTVTVEVVRRGKRIAFICTDDGRGVDLEAVERLARAKGLLPSGAVARAHSPEDLVAVLLRGGLTTSGAVTDLSGRGVGLDVVREAAARLGGDVHVRTTAGIGTSFELVVPVSMSSMEALLVEASGVAAAIPLDAVRKTVRLAVADVGHGAEGRSVLHEGAVIPFVPLAPTLGVPAADAATTAFWSAVVVSDGPRLAAVGVDRLLGTGNVVVRPLPTLAPAEAAVAGLSLDEQGDPQIVLDPAGLIAWAHESVHALPRATQRSLAPILVVDDSLTTRMLEQSILESAGYAVELAVSAEEALQKAHATGYSLFLVDVEMPGMSGFEFVERTRADPKLREVPAILVTSRDAAEDRERGRTAGASAYIVKGEFDQNVLLGIIARLVG